MAETPNSGPEQAKAAYPDFPWLEADDPRGVAEFLQRRGWLEPQERVGRVEKAGEGNMNLALRVLTDRRRLVRKQARPWVEKYREIPAPWDRALMEVRFYEKIATVRQLAERMPTLLAADADARALLLTDLSPARDMTGVYSGHPVSPDELATLAEFIRTLHDAFADQPEPELANRDMRDLNHEHIFRLPLDGERNPLDLTQFGPRLAEVAVALRTDAAYVSRVTETGQRYLADGACLLHGDYFPGSWLRTASGLYVIDPEFCFFGDRAWDLGVAVAHLALAGLPRELAEGFLTAYGNEVDEPLLARFAGCEVMRRLIGVAQLPLPEDREGHRAELLARTREAIMGDDWRGLWSV